MENLAILSLASAAARHASYRQSLAAANIANADTPGYRPVDLPVFSVDRGVPLRETRAQHVPLGGSAGLVPGLMVEVLPDGNAVTLDVEMAKAAEAELRHDLATTIWQRGLGLLRMAVANR
ncbi:MAG TPA: flagellar basal body protein [Alphaproteobacteria bacterium]|nr:flagellar basal body protein [Alphaproteobacteria bacterium]